MQDPKTRVEFLQELSSLTTRAIKLVEEGMVAHEEHWPALRNPDEEPRESYVRVAELSQIEHEVLALEHEYRKYYGKEDEENEKAD